MLKPPISVGGRSQLPTASLCAVSLMSVKNSLNRGREREQGGERGRKRVLAQTWTAVWKHNHRNVLTVRPSVLDLLAALTTIVKRTWPIPSRVRLKSLTLVRCFPVHPLMPKHGICLFSIQ